MEPDTIIQFHIEGRTITRDFKRSIKEIVLEKGGKELKYR
jgi:hypothetical protein